MTQRRNGVYVYVSWLAKLMASQNPCWWSGWFQAHYTHYDKRPSDFDLPTWIAEHTIQVRELVKGLAGPGHLVMKEDANWFRYIVAPGVVVGGKPDVIDVQERALTIYDAKTGKRRDSDRVQTMLYMLLVPRSLPHVARPTTNGCVVYTDGRQEIPPEAVNEKFEGVFRYFLDVVVSEDEPERAPGAHMCRFCDLTSDDCPERTDTAITEPVLGTPG